MIKAFATDCKLIGPSEISTVSLSSAILFKLFPPPDAILDKYILGQAGKGKALICYIPLIVDYLESPDFERTELTILCGTIKVTVPESAPISLWTQFALT